MTGSHKSQVLIPNNEAEISVGISSLHLNIKDNVLALPEFHRTSVIDICH